MGVPGLRMGMGMGMGMGMDPGRGTDIDRVMMVGGRRVGRLAWRRGEGRGFRAQIVEGGFSS